MNTAKDEITGIFKYRTYKSAKEIIESGKLWFSQPKDFNDHFDCSPEILKEHFYFHFTSKRDSRFDREIDELIQLFGGGDDVRKLLAKPEKVAQAYAEIQAPKIASCSVLCFGRLPHNKLNWSSYGDAGKGICLGFDWGVPQFFQDFGNHELSSGPVTYGWPLEKINFFSDKMKNIAAIYLTKTEEWKHEDEFRMILLNKTGGFKFHKDALTTVTFGLKVEDEVIFSFRQLCIDNGYTKLKFYKIAAKGVELVINRIIFNDAEATS